MPAPKCSVCGGRVARAPSFKELGQQLDAFIVCIGAGVEYHEPVFKASVCWQCDRIYCFNCHDKNAKGVSCPNCGNDMYMLGEFYLRRRRKKKWWKFLR